MAEQQEMAWIPVATLGQNSSIKQLVTVAQESSALLKANSEFAKTSLETAKIFLSGILNPQALILKKIATEIRNITNDFRQSGLYFLQVNPHQDLGTPLDRDGNPIKIAITKKTIEKRKTDVLKASIEKPYLKENFNKWAITALGEPDVFTELINDLEYYMVEQKNSVPSLKNDDSVGTTNQVVNLPMLTPSEIIAQMISAIDDVGDEYRPQFSASSSVGASVVIMGFTNPQTVIDEISTAIGGITSFFGGENGLLGQSFVQMGKILTAVTGNLEDVTKNNVTLKVTDIVGMKGTVEDSSNFTDSEPQYIKRPFEVNDCVVGPRTKFGARALGYVSEITDTTYDTIKATQTLVVTGATELDAVAFRQAGNGSKLQLVHYYKKTLSHIDNNSGETVNTGETNSYKYFQELTNEEMLSANTKVIRPKSKPLLDVISTTDITKIVSSGPRSQIVYPVSVIGTIEIAKEDIVSQLPDFVEFRLTEMIPQLNIFLDNIDTLSYTLEGIAADTGDAIKDFEKFVDSKIEELDKLTKTLQEILDIFSIGLGDAGVHVLQIPVNAGGIDYIKESLQSAPDKPSNQMNYCFGFIMIGGSVQFEMLSKILGS